MEGAGETASLEIFEVNTPAPLGPSTPQREQAIERLSRSFAEDGITMDEFERRAELVYRAITVADLQELVADLPALAEPVETGRGKKSVALVSGDRISTLLGSTERRMPASVPRFLTVRTALGNTELDFRGSRFEPGITEVQVRCLFGSIELTVPEGVRVELMVSSVLANVSASRQQDFDDGPPSQSVLRVTGRAMFANVEVHTGHSPGDTALT